ncbi:MAG: hypothetical protein ABJM06_08220 [Gilvibacter sp.]
MNQESSTAHWGFKNIGFRFGFVYLVLYTFPFPLTYIPGVYWLLGWYRNSSEWLVNNVGEHIFGVTEMSSAPTGSGDKMYDFMFMATCFIVAIIAAVIWSVLDRKRPNYEKLWLYLHTWLRYYLACFLLSYGFSKVFVLQFSELSLFDLVKTYGDSSPMALAWNFMEYSDSYTIFTGIGEVLGGLLLLFRRTLILGCIVTIAVMATVVMINFSFDVPVKLFSSHLLLIAFVLLIPDYKRLIKLFFLNKTVPPAEKATYFKNPSYNIAANVVKGLFIAYVLILQTSNSISGQKQYGKKAEKPALYGIYKTVHFVVNKDTIAPLTTDAERWNKLIIGKRSAGVQFMNNSLEYYNQEFLSDTIKLQGYEKFILTFIENEKFLILDGSRNSDTVHIKLRKIDHTQMNLLRRGFNWVNEVPFNR